MKTLIIDNGSSLVDKLIVLCPGSEIVVGYQNIPHDVSEYSLIILSGSSKFPVLGNIDDLNAEINLIRNATVPIVGICLGHELIAHAFGAEVKYLGMQHKGMYDVVVAQEHVMFGGRNTFSVYENHQYGITTVSPELEILAQSQNSIAVIKHTDKPIYGFQFHPEHMTDQQFGDEVFLNLFNVVTRST